MRLEDIQSFPRMKAPTQSSNWELSNSLFIFKEFKVLSYFEFCFRIENGAKKDFHSHKYTPVKISHRSNYFPFGSYFLGIFQSMGLFT